MGRSKAIAGQYIVLQPGQYLDISQEQGKYLDNAWEHFSFDLHFDLLVVALEISNLIHSKACNYYLWYRVLHFNNHSKYYYINC